MSVAVQSNRMDTDEEYVEVYDDEDADDHVPISKPRAKQPSQLRRYKDDAYRCCSLAVHLLLRCWCMQCEGICIRLYSQIVPIHPVRCFQLWRQRKIMHVVQTLYRSDTLS